MQTPHESPDGAVPLTVCYASQTGTAQEYAERFARQARRKGFVVQVERLDEEAVPRLAEKRVCVFFVSTTGDGELPDHSKPWWRALLRRDLPKTALASLLRFAVFGLGDSSYIRFNAAARKIAARLPQLGAAPLCERGLGDEQSEPGGLDQDYDQWSRTQLLPALEALKGTELLERVVSPTASKAQRLLQRSEAGAAPVPLPGKLRSRYSVTILPPAADGASAHSTATAATGSPTGPLEPVITGHTAGLLPLGGSADGPLLWPATVTRNDRLTAEGWPQDVRSITLDYAQSDMPSAGFVAFRPGDVAMVYPRNTGTAAAQEAVAFFSEYLGLPLETRLVITTRGHHHATDTPPDEGEDAEETDSPLQAFPLHPITLRQLLECVLDIQGIPRRSFLELAAVYCLEGTTSVDIDISRDAMEQAEKMLELSGYLSSATGEEGSYGAGLYRLYALKEARNYSEVLRDFSACRIPLEALLELIPTLKPRHFSIASSSVSVSVAEGECRLRSSLDLCVGLVEYLTPLKRAKVGVCSGFMASLKPSDVVWMQIRKGSWSPPWPLPLSLPSPSSSPASLDAPDAAALAGGLSVPLLLVGPGTGIAPMRAIWQERHAAIATLQSLSPASNASVAGDAIAPCWLFYGCRNAAKDWLFADEIEALVKQQKPHMLSAVTHYDAAFSRPSESAASAPPPPQSTATGTTSTDATPAASSVNAANAAGDGWTTAAVTAVSIVSGGSSMEVDQPADARRSDLMHWCVSAASNNRAGSDSDINPPSVHYDIATPFRMRANAAVTYVQKRIAAHAGELRPLLLEHPSSLVFISGSAKRMPSDVIGELRDEVMVKQGNMSAEDAKKLVSQLEARRRLVVEAWS